MSDWYNHPQVFIRSLASRGSMGGLHPKIIEVTDTVKAAGFDIVIIETVGVGQSEIEIAGLADITVVVLVPEAGDEVQTMKSGLMEIADVFVVNKADRPGAGTFVKNLQQMLAPAFHNHAQEIPVVKTIAAKKEGVEELKQKLAGLQSHQNADRKLWLLTEKAYQLIRNKRMKNVSKQELKEKIAKEKNGFNLYSFVAKSY
jgi:LAO/AO transport system kinase